MKARKEPRELRYRDNAFYVSIVDEAHALMNFQAPRDRGTDGLARGLRAAGVARDPFVAGLGLPDGRRAELPRQGDDDGG